MARNTPPAITREFQEDDDVTVHATPYDSVSFSPGFGDSGYKLQRVEHECPACDFPQMFRRHDVAPNHPDEVRYWCLNPNCGHFVGELFAYACEGFGGATEPVVNE